MLNTCTVDYFFKLLLAGVHVVCKKHFLLMGVHFLWPVLENVANLLRVDIYELTDALTQKSMILRGEEIQSPLSVEQVQ